MDIFLRRRRMNELRLHLKRFLKAKSPKGRVSISASQVPSCCASAGRISMPHRRASSLSSEFLCRGERRWSRVPQVHAGARPALERRIALENLAAY